MNDFIYQTNQMNQMDLNIDNISNMPGMLSMPGIPAVHETKSNSNKLAAMCYVPMQE